MKEFAVYFNQVEQIQHYIVSLKFILSNPSLKIAKFHKTDLESLAFFCGWCVVDKIEIDTLFMAHIQFGVYNFAIFIVPSESIIFKECGIEVIPIGEDKKPTPPPTD